MYKWKKCILSSSNKKTLKPFISKMFSFKCLSTRWQRSLINWLPPIAKKKKMSSNQNRRLYLLNIIILCMKKIFKRFGCHFYTIRCKRELSEGEQMDPVYKSRIHCVSSRLRAGVEPDRQYIDFAIIYFQNNAQFSLWSHILKLLD